MLLSKKMKQPVKKIHKKKKASTTSSSKSKKQIVKKTTISKHPKYGTSKLEKDFAHEFLDKYGIRYIYEYEAKDIKRFYDFAIITKKAKYITEEKEGLTSIIQGIQHTPIDLLIEIDGGYFHSDPRVVDENKLSPMQKHNKMVDEIKNKWAYGHNIPLLRIWEYDIRKKPKKVLEELKKYISIDDKNIEKAKKRIMKLK